MTSLLAIETSSEACSVALSLNGDLLERRESAPRRHAELLLPAIEGLLAEAGLDLSGLEAIAFGCGPGSFTSLRIGIGVVQGLAWAAGLPVVPVSSLAAVAQQALEHHGAAAVPVCVAVDARMQEVFSGWYRPDALGMARAEGAERVCTPAALSAVDRNGFLAAGNAFARFPEMDPLGREALGCYPDIVPNAASVARLAQHWLRDNAPLPAALAQPVYVRNKVAEKPAGASVTGSG